MKRIKKYIDDNGVSWDSKAEFQFFCYLQESKDKYNIKEIHRQVKYILQEPFTLCSKKIQAITYKSDFTLILEDGRIVIIDVKPPLKSIWDAKFIIKWKMMMNLHRDYIYKIISWKNKEVGWVEM
ncbi:DUF1064 domain-containing protein [Inconstantimicrobium mannanitabidum]|uniref:Uncharacterized protein n=1 Tax=Inconstantimicrobium mannanitabidum TaxID=1604901 RepID=A0ACB5R9G2_9CLOT|nr:DUF1064 domain-containing protein [Clostridium sp. TW13]GKX65819.1 hypothetical protein rsdtw13_10770 [Clostridium sp. TW13]